MEDQQLQLQRELEDTGLEFDDVSDLPMHEVISTSLSLYGTIFVVCFVLFLFGRWKYPQGYLILRNKDEHTGLSQNIFGPLSWIYHVFQVDDEEILQDCGMDAIVFLRTLRFGMRIAAISVLQGVYLFPVYAASGGDLDQLESVTLANIPQGGAGLLAATVACYIVYTFALYLLYKELMWYTEHRHLLLKQPRVENYTVHVKFIPTEWQSNQALVEYFTSIFGYDAIFEAQIAYQIPILEKAVADRDVLCGTEDKIGKLEHALNVYQVKGVRPKHPKMIVSDVTLSGEENRNGKKKCGCKCRPPTEMVDSIDEYTAELENLNETITSTIHNIETKTSNNGEESFRGDLEAAIERSQRDNGITQNHEKEEEETIDVAFTDQTNDSLAVEETNSQTNEVGDESANNSSRTNKSDELVAESSNKLDKLTSSGSRHMRSFTAFASGATNKLVSGVDSGANMIGSGATLVGGLLTAKPDGEPRSAGFVTFTTLKAKTSALQMLHHPTPFCLDVETAPSPSQVVWGNVGMLNKVQQVGRLVASALTIILCLFWTVIVSFVTGLGEVEKLTELMPFLEDWLVAAPWLSMFLNQIKPLLLVMLVSYLPKILTQFSEREGHIAESSLQTSVFFKLSVFLIIQMFFVQMLSGSILSELENFIKQPMQIITLLAEALPKQAQSFMQYVIVQTALNLGLELFRPVEIIKAWIRGLVGPNLTPEERSKPWFSFLPLTFIPEFEYCDRMGTLILYYMILFCYSVMSPFTSVILFCAFFLFSLGYRHQLFYLYKRTDSGGEFFPAFLSLVVACIIISEITMAGVLALKGGVVASPLLFPLIVGTFLFKLYLNQQHILITKNLPSTMAVEQDLNHPMRSQLEQGAYRQPALQERYLVPSNMPRDINDVGTSSQAFLTPRHSEVEILEGYN
mmetsp:Transcript_20895/g.31647  ORF Transcript_20895/g.31647 Transcript_20895/m.31647 type:complete len:914 (+) Transcript_20895:35-2776(+)